MKPILHDLAVTYRTLLDQASEVDSDSKHFDDLLAAASYTAQAIKVRANLPPEATLREMPYSEVCMHMKVAGMSMWTVPVGDRMTQLFTLEGQRFSFPITNGEAGVHHSDLELYR